MRVSSMPTRDVQFFATPALWPCWPFLPVIRRSANGDGIVDGHELGLMYDTRGTAGPTGFVATVFLCNLFELPETEVEFLALPREVFDTAEEVAAAGWRVD